MRFMGFTEMCRGTYIAPPDPPAEFEGGGALHGGKGKGGMEGIRGVEKGGVVGRGRWGEKRDAEIKRQVWRKEGKWRKGNGGGSHAFEYCQVCQLESSDYSVARCLRSPLFE